MLIAVAVCETPTAGTHAGDTLYDKSHRATPDADIFRPFRTNCQLLYFSTIQLINLSTYQLFNLLPLPSTSKYYILNTTYCMLSLCTLVLLRPFKICSQLLGSMHWEIRITQHFTGHYNKISFLFFKNLFRLFSAGYHSHCPG